MRPCNIETASDLVANGGYKLAAANRALRKM